MTKTERMSFLSDAESLLDGLRVGGIGVWRWRIGSDSLDWTQNLEQVHGLPRGAFDATLSSFRRDIHPEDAAFVWERIEDAVSSGEPYRVVYRTAPREDEQPLWIETCGGTVTGRDGTRFLTGVCQDVTARVRDEEELKHRLFQQQAIAKFGSFALVESSFENILARAVSIAAEALRVPLTKILQFADSADHLILKAGIGWRSGLVGVAAVGIGETSQAGFTLTSGEPVIVRDFFGETRFRGPTLLLDHGVRSGMSMIIPGVDARPFGVFGAHDVVVRDFTESDVEFFVALTNIVANSARHHAADAQRDLLLREMAHRAGNMLQLVSTIANQTFAGDNDIDSARHAFSERLGSLSRANYLVAQGGWTSTRIISLLEQALQPFLTRLTFTGRDILLPPDLSFDLGLIVHELATNSAKYGTLGSEEGVVSIHWRIGRGDEGGTFLQFTWDDPQPSRSEAATNTGFGSKLLVALIERKWGGEIVVERTQGYRHLFTLRLADATTDLTA